MPNPSLLHVVGLAIRPTLNAHLIFSRIRNREIKSCMTRSIPSSNDDATKLPVCSRRNLLRRGTLGFGSIALAGLMADDGLLWAAGIDPRPVVPTQPAKAKNVIFIFLSGGPGQVDTFDPKPELTKLHGQDVPPSIANDVPQIARSPLNNLLASPWKFQRYGESGIPVSDLFPYVGRCIDDICVIRSCRHTTPIHAPAEFITLTGTQVGNRPSLGAWLNYGLGSENKDLPGFIVFKTGNTLRPPALGAGFLPARFQGTLVDAERGVPNLQMPSGVTKHDRRAQLDLINALNQKHLRRHAGNSELEARIKAYELSFRMQTAAPEAFDLTQETRETQDLYGLHQKETAEYAKYFMLTRRMIERGVRFIQIRSGGWDAHVDLLGNHDEKCQATDQPIAALLTDLKRRGLLEETLVIWGGEFGRTPTHQRGAAKPGRDHSPSGYSMWLAGGGVRGGQVIGATDPIGYAAIERPVHPNDLHATILHALGIDQTELVYRHHNRDEMVTVNGGEVVHEVFG